MISNLNNKRKLDKKTAELVLQVLAKPGQKRNRKKSAAITLKAFLGNKIQINRVINHGVPYSFFESVRDYAPFKNEVWSRLLNISGKTLSRYKMNRITSSALLKFERFPFDNRLFH